MAAVPVGAPPPAKRKKEGPDCLETSPVPPAMVGADWSSLPYDLLRRIADTLLDTNDVDCYMDLRAVCRHWRSTTDDPRSDATDPRFRPRQWIVLDEVFASDTRRLLVNTASGRCLHRELPQLRDHHVVATTLGGFFVLADKSPPHAARVFNPLTGGLISFNAPVPPEGKVAAAVCFGMASPMLTLLCDSSRKHYTAFPDSECFITHEHEHQHKHNYGILRMAIRGGFDGGLQRLTQLQDVVFKINNSMKLVQVHPARFLFDNLPETADPEDMVCFLMEFGGQALTIAKLHRLIKVIKFEPEHDVRARLQSIGRFAIFVGHARCLAVDADKFPSVEANCVYYIERLGSSAHMCKYNLQDEKDERVSDAVDFVKHNKQFVLAADRPFTIIHLIASYTINVRDSELASQQIPFGEVFDEDETSPMFMDGGLLHLDELYH
ncbi:uncharacterized protein LOC125547181 [Triticum urartu]|nr:uncharacterized protein LOC125547180 [Triticum urartu]XP_048567123.1 uncharacterized protein LOC125547181 [Triticum urartu]